MDYKRIFKTRKMRTKILRFLSFIPDRPMLKLQYWIKTGRRLDLKKPQRFTEKLQWYKLYYKNPLMIQCVDKYDVRDYVKSKGLKDILIPCYGVYDNVDSIDWNLLPNQFVIKDTLGGGGNKVIIIKDKESVNIDELCNKLRSWVSAKPARKSGGREWPYYSGKNHRIIIEHFLSSNESEGGLIEYKFFCFDGKPEWLYVLANREFGVSVELGGYDDEFNKQDVIRNDERPLSKDIQKPTTFNQMKEIASQLASGFPHARIDLYNENGQVRFGEITFFDGSGYMTYSPDTFDFTLGKNFLLKKYND